ncbi:MAG: HNH endonuclease [Gaiellaceae bacterium]
MHDPDEALRSACFAELRRLTSLYSQDVPYRGALERGFPFSARSIPFLTPYKGIFRAREQRGPAALSINTSIKSPYRDRATADGWVYSYRTGDVDQPDNNALRAAHELQTPIVYFHATAAGYYEPLFPWFVDADDPVEREVHVTPGKVIDLGSKPISAQIDDPVERQYVFRETRVRVHQAHFRRLILPPYQTKCTICSLREERLLDAAHIIGDADDQGEPVISNGLSLCTIHHRAFDNDLVGISPDYEVHVSRSLLQDEDGPMLDLLKGFHRQSINLPRRRAWRPDPERLAIRFERFRSAA